MKDAERIYALYIQANPIPDPDLLPLTHDEAALLTLERSQEMETKERAVDRPVRPPRKRNRIAAVVTATVVMVAAVVAVAWLVADGEEAAVPAVDAAPEVTFDGATCVYRGPGLIEQGMVEFTTVNSGSSTVGLAGWLMTEPALSAELERTPVGTDMALDPTAPMPEGRMWFVFDTGTGESTTWPVTLMAGTYLIDCVTYTNGVSDHVWRPAQIEVVAP